MVSRILLKSWIKIPACIVLAPTLLSACVTVRDIEPYGYACSHGLNFQARLYSDMVALDGARGHDQLPREADGPEGSFRFGNERLKAEFGLGVNKRLATLRYADIPQTIHCERALIRLDQASQAQTRVTGAVLVGKDGAQDDAMPELKLADLPGPKPKAPPEPPDPKDLVYTNIRFGGGPGPN